MHPHTHTLAPRFRNQNIPIRLSIYRTWACAELCIALHSMQCEKLLSWDYLIKRKQNDLIIWKRNFSGRDKNVHFDTVLCGAYASQEWYKNVTQTQPKKMCEMYLICIWNVQSWSKITICISESNGSAKSLNYKNNNRTHRVQNTD